MSATVAYPARSALEPGRTASAEFTLMQRRVPPSATFCRATAWPVVPEPAKKSSTTASAGIVCSSRRTRPVGFGDSKTWPTIALSSATAVSVEPTSSASQIVRSFLRRPPGPSRCSQSFWNTSTRSPSRPLMTRQTRSSGRCSIRGADHRHTAGRPSPNTGSISTAPSKGVGATRPDTGSPYTGKCKVRAVTGLNFLLVLRSGRCRYRRPSGDSNGKSAGSTVSVLLASSTHRRTSRAYASRYSCDVANPLPS